ncbi:phosphoribosyltransferase [Paenibacillus sp. PK3_47]|uniref:phosphoribosyltransferase family protein n=1 Tax=Paenibacillus sp. PK3_47 TaxID=2072642 RepID=UPI00201DD889|nr:phosphoribosyltransferase family protein [Paenibacillus sp. PK3_47]UQZ37519.1 phosphoribosyltransferase [Paenibacillus sp. PK3_47]
MAARINKKRSFLFVSRVLGKHIPVNPYTPLLGGAALALLLYREMNGGAADTDSMEKLLEQAVDGLIDPSRAEEAYRALLSARLVLPRPVVFIGFAETATALGHSMYNIFADHASYIHTTREDIPEMEPVVSFEEEHSHAVDHLVYALNTGMLSGEEPVVLVDDEITTGNTAINTIRDIQSKFPRREYVVASLLDWRSERNIQAYRELEEELGIRITALSLLQGSIEVTGTPLLDAAAGNGQLACASEVPVVTTYVADGLERLEVSSADSYGEVNHSPYLKLSGRFGMESCDNQLLDEGAARIAARLCKLRESSNALVMGVGEFMYLPMRVAAEMGEGISYQSSTRSPIYPEARPDYGVHSAEAYPSAGDPAIRNYIYNIAPGQYGDIFVLLERDVPRSRIEPMTDVLKSLAGNKVHLIILGARQETEAACP